MDELRRLDFLIRLQVLNQRNNDQADSLRQFKGLVISDMEIDELLARPSGQIATATTNSPPEKEVQIIKENLAACEDELKNRAAASSRQNIFLPLRFLSDTFHLTPFEEQCLIICLAVELDRKYTKFYGYLHDDVLKRQPSVGLVLELLCGTLEEKIKARRFFDWSAPLFRYQLLHFVADPSDSSHTLFSRSLKIDERTANLLLGITSIDSRLKDIVRLAAHPENSVTDIAMPHAETLSRLRDLASTFYNKKSDTDGHLFVYLHGPHGTGKRLLVESVCRDMGFPLLIADLGRPVEGCLAAEEMLLLIGREAAFHHAALCLCNLDVFLADDADHQRFGILKRILRTFSRLAFLAGTKPWNPPEFTDDGIFISLEFKIPDDKIRKSHWEGKSPEYAPFADDIDFGEMAGKFRFTPLQIRNALAEARNTALWRHGPGSFVTAEDLHSACRNQSRAKLGTLACKIGPKSVWKDIILPDDQMNHLREICNHARYRHIVYGEWGFGNKLSYGKGLTALFSGPPGTGKTMAAEVIANELGLDLYKIDLSQVVSKYIGETEKNLDRVFNEAGTSNAILFFDEADALFGKRSEVKDAHDRYANIETGYLLQKMEEYEGIAILATNLRSNMDEAFVRRMNFIVELPFPRERERRAIWEGIWPDSTPRCESLDLDFVARRFEITGGNIRNIALAAAFMAADNGGVVSMRHLVSATRREYQKMGKIVSAGEFGEHDAKETRSPTRGWQ